MPSDPTPHPNPSPKQAGRASAEMTSRITTLDERFAGPPPEPWSVMALPPAATETTERCAEFELALRQQARASTVYRYIGQDGRANTE